MHYYVPPVLTVNVGPETAMEARPDTDSLGV
jgi:hypothetical protein